ncbi:MAG: glycosyltransferase, partial [Actinobacteria bacterium]|nr:glycosyltransferase [Actinomycetota bacterium]
MTVVAIVPAKDRADSIGSTIASLRTVRTIDRILVVDDGSTDDTTAVARSAGAAVLRLGANRGKAGAVATGVAAEPDADIYVLVDADVRDDAAQVAALLTPVLAGEADLAIGVLPSAGTRGGFGLVRRFAHWGVQRGSGFDAKAPLSGQRVVRGDFLRGMDGVARFGLEVAMTIDAARAGARVVEIEVPMEHLHTGRSVAGFAHRGRQGRDVFEALWPRLVPRVVRRIGLVALVFAFLALSFVGSHANTVASTPLTRRARHVVIIGVPHLGLGDLGNGEMPNLDRLMAGGSVAKMTIQTGGGTQSSSEYATLGASAQVTGPGVTQVAGRDERIEGSPAIDVLERRSGARPSGALIVASMPAVLRSSGKLENSQPGALGDALHAAGLTTAVVANSDTVDDSGLRSTSAPAAFAVTSTAGAIDAGSVAPSLTHRDPRRPFGMNADVSAIAREFAKVAPTSAVTVIDPGDTDRAAAYAGGAGKDQADVLRKQALAETDRVIGSIDRRLPTDTLLIVTAMSPPTSQAELVPIVMSGAGVTQGQLLSPSTGQDGLVTLTNVAPTVLASLGVAVPPKMIGRPIRFTTTKPDLSAFRRSNKISVDRDRAYSTFLHSFIQVQILLYLLAAIALVRTGTPRLARRVLRFGVVTVALVPLMTFVIRIFPVLGSFGTGTVALLWALSALISWVIHDRGRSPWGPLVAVCSANIVLLAIDLSLGGPLQDSSLLGFS